MRHYCAVVFLISCFALPATAARAAELEGFGPIKFGMTKEEAWAAIDGHGEWLGENSLVYERPVDRGTIMLKVYQGFTDGRAVEATVVYDPPIDPLESLAGCREKTLIMAGLIREKYDKIPLAHYGGKSTAGIEKPMDVSVFDLLLFSFPRGAYIKITGRFTRRIKGDDCLILLLYRPPTDDKIPF